MSTNVLAISQTRAAQVFSSLRAASRSLSGNGTDSKRWSITDRCDNGGGFVGDVWVQYTDYPVGIKRK